MSTFMVISQFFSSFENEIFLPLSASTKLVVKETKKVKYLSSSTPREVEDFRENNF